MSLEEIPNRLRDIANELKVIAGELNRDMPESMEVIISAAEFDPEKWDPPDPPIPPPYYPRQCGPPIPGPIESVQISGRFPGAFADDLSDKLEVLGYVTERMINRGMTG